jgi:DNA-binding NarL/FixJ family response regulator
VSNDNPKLTPRELEVLAYLTAGTSNREIAKELRISASTVKGHLGSIYAKLHVSNRTEAALIGLDVFPMLRVYAS